MNSIEVTEKLALNARYMTLEPAEECGISAARSARTAPSRLVERTSSASSGELERLGIYQAALPGGRRVPLLKTLLTSACERDCLYCPFRARRNFRRQTFSPEEMAATFMSMHQAGLVQGLFLSSGLAGSGVRTEDRLLASAEILRQKLGYRGYLHLKLMPGAERAQIERAMQLADRVSINLEAPSSERLARLAPHKRFADLLEPLSWAEALRRQSPPPQGKDRWPSLTTQFVVGAAGESDRELLELSAKLFGQLHLQRVYYSAFSPVEDTPLEGCPAEEPRRAARLYQASFLLRDYGFAAGELPYDEQGELPLQSDPKLAWAQAHLSEAPVELNTADRATLLRVPGIGPRSADAILRARRTATLREPRALRPLGVSASRALPFILLDGKRPARQLPLPLGD